MQSDIVIFVVQQGKEHQMELNQLYYFRVVAETQNMTEAAEKLHITQPTLSKVIKRLEEDLGVKLFDRRASRLELNPYGGSYLVYVNQALDALDRGKKCLSSMQTGEKQGLRLASTFFGLSTMLVESFIEQNSDLAVIESSEDPERIISLLLNDHTDFALTLFPPDHPEVEQIISIREPLLLLVPRSMQPPTEPVRLADYESARFAIFEGGKDQNANILRCCSEAHFVPNIVYRTTRCQIVHDMIDKLQVCTLMPAHMVMSNWDHLPPEIHERIRLVEEPQCYRTICLSRKRQAGPLNPGKEAFVTFATHFIEKIDQETTEKLRKYQK